MVLSLRTHSLEPDDYAEREPVVVLQRVGVMRGDVVRLVPDRHVPGEFDVRPTASKTRYGIEAAGSGQEAEGIAEPVRSYQEMTEHGSPSLAASDTRSARHD